MTARAAHLVHEALQLTPQERAEMAAELLASLDEPEDADVEAAWAEEIERRARRVLAGESSGTDWAEARARIVQSALKR
ncbi:MAG TPA: addiction module protein [Thermoanaerobaculia bacterium]|nr:addiction module protein [Thermoanaerobaculia bacterium]